MRWWECAIEQRAREGRLWLKTKAKLPGLRFSEQMAGGGVNALGRTYLGGGMWSLDAGMRESSSARRRGVGGTLAKTEHPWLGFCKRMAGCGVNTLGGTYLGGGMWNLDAGIRESSGARRREVEGTLAKTERSWLGFRKRRAGGTYFGRGM